MPVTFSSLDNPNDRYWRASLTSPDNAPYNTVTADYVLPGGSGYLSGVGDLIGNHFATVQYDRTGVWAQSNPNDAQTGYCDGIWHFHCQRVFLPEGLGSAIHDPCVDLFQVQPHPRDCVVACLPRDLIYRDLAGIIAQTNAGQVKTAPGTDRGLVNLADCGWIEGAQGATQRQYVFSVAGPADSTGRAIRYEYVVTVGPLSVLWNYDDPDQPGFQPGDFGQVWTQGGICSNPHVYRRISSWNPDQRAHITVKETYGAFVNVVWYDGANVHQYEIGELAETFTIWAAPEAQFVGQVEGIPTNS